MQAVILAGGRGRRLAPYTVTFPKPMVPVDDMPILEIVLRQLKQDGFENVTMAVGHLSELLQAYFQDGSRFGIEIEYSKEQQPLGTVGPLKEMEHLPETFLVMNGDILTSLSYRKLMDYHLQSGAELTIACHRCTTNVDLGVIEFDGQLLVTGYREKPKLTYDVSMGIYVFNRSVLECVPDGEKFDFPQLVDALIRSQRRVKVYLSDDDWLDIGRESDYARATEEFQKRRSKFLPCDTDATPTTVVN
jgi:NDP-sugar pyrophosphorylase family protein